MLPSLHLYIPKTNYHEHHVDNSTLQNYSTIHHKVPSLPQYVDNSILQNCSTSEIHKTIFVITPTYKRSTQKVDLTSMCHTLMHVQNVVWIIIEDAPKPTKLVTNLLQHCKVETVHLHATTSAVEKGENRASKSRGVDQRNAGLAWLRKHYNAENCNGVVYFGDDDNKYDLRLFDEVCLSTIPHALIGHSLLSLGSVLAV